MILIAKFWINLMKLPSFTKFIFIAAGIGMLMPLLALVTAITGWGNLSFWFFMTKLFFFPAFFGLAGAGPLGGWDFWLIFMITLASNMLLYAIIGASIWCSLKYSLLLLILPGSLILYYAQLLFRL